MIICTGFYPGWQWIVLPVGARNQPGRTQLGNHIEKGQFQKHIQFQHKKKLQIMMKERTKLLTDAGIIPTG